MRHNIDIGRHSTGWKGSMSCNVRYITALTIRWDVHANSTSTRPSRRRLSFPGGRAMKIHRSVISPVPWAIAALSFYFALGDKGKLFRVVSQQYHEKQLELLESTLRKLPCEVRRSSFSMDMPKSSLRPLMRLDAPGCVRLRKRITKARSRCARALHRSSRTGFGGRSSIGSQAQ